MNDPDEDRGLGTILVILAGVIVAVALLSGYLLSGCLGPGEVDRGIAPNLAEVGGQRSDARRCSSAPAGSHHTALASYATEPGRRLAVPGN